MIPMFGTSATTYIIDKQCGPTEDIPDPCEIEEIEDYGVPTGHLLCAPHGEVVGTVILPKLGSS